MTELSKQAKTKGKIIGFVPTMGYLHEGHLSLIRAARKRCDILVVSIFVNPIQFGPKEDLKNYPRDLKRDIKLVSPLKADYLFVPDKDDILPEDFSSFVDVPGLSEKLCGRSRPGHFRGVATIVAKLFNIVNPDIAFFGEKDFQQLAIIKKMVSDLNMGVKVIGMPTIREPDGLAMSSRNVFLSANERTSAAAIYRSLKLAERMVEGGEDRAVNIIKAMKKLLSRERPKIIIDYVQACDPVTLESVNRIKGETLIAVAAYPGPTRLIDNILVRGE